MLGEVESVLANANDYVERANALSFRSRILRQLGNYPEAINKSREAILVYDVHKDKTHRGLARCLAHMAFALILYARTLAELRRGPSTEDDIHLALEQADEALRSAAGIAERHGYARVLDRVHYYRAWWHLECADSTTELAIAEARAAYRVAKATNDHAIMTHARIMESKLTEDPASALDLARQAVEIAGKTDSRRARMRAGIRLAMAYLRDDGFANKHEAEKLYQEAKNAKA